MFRVRRSTFKVRGSKVIAANHANGYFSIGYFVGGVMSPTTAGFYPVIDDIGYYYYFNANGSIGTITTKFRNDVTISTVWFVFNNNKGAPFTGYSNQAVGDNKWYSFASGVASVVEGIHNDVIGDGLYYNFGTGGTISPALLNGYYNNIPGAPKWHKFEGGVDKGALNDFYFDVGGNGVWRYFIDGVEIVPVGFWDGDLFGDPGYQWYSDGIEPLSRANMGAASNGWWINGINVQENTTITAGYYFAIDNYKWYQFDSTARNLGLVMNTYLDTGYYNHGEISLNPNVGVHVAVNSSYNDYRKCLYYNADGLIDSVYYWNLVQTCTSTLSVINDPWITHDPLLSLGTLVWTFEDSVATTVNWTNGARDGFHYYTDQTSITAIHFCSEPYE